MRADVCIIGAGPAGLTVGHRLAGAGLTVLVLEAGCGSPPPGGDEVTSTDSVGLPYAIGESRAQGMGGSSLRWDIETPVGDRFVRLRELDPIDFEARSGVAGSGWPFSKHALERHYRDAWKLFGLDRPSGDHVLASGLERRIFSFGSATTFTDRLSGALAHHARVSVMTGVCVTDIRTDQQPEVVSSLACRTAEGATFGVKATAYVLAGGGIENARLLLASRSRMPGGLGNHHDRVGRYFMEHPHFTAGVLSGHVAELETDLKLSARGGQAYEARFGLDPALIRREGLLNAVFHVYPRPISSPFLLRRDGTEDEPAEMALAVLASALRQHRKPGLGPGGLARLTPWTASISGHVARQVLGRRARRRGRVARAGGIYAVEVMAEQEPLADSRVRLRNDVDGFGVPRAELDWRLSELDALSVARTTELVGRDLARAFGGRFRSLIPPSGLPSVGGGWHHMGTTRMSTSPASGVVDADSRVHGIHNLYVAGSSAFSTSGYANPTLTLVALASRLGEILAKELLARPTV